MWCWENDPSIMKFGKENNLTDGKALYGYFMRRYAVLLGKHNKTAVGWYEVFDNVALDGKKTLMTPDTVSIDFRAITLGVLFGDVGADLR